MTWLLSAVIGTNESNLYPRELHISKLPSSYHYAFLIDYYQAHRHWVLNEVKAKLLACRFIAVTHIFTDITILSMLLSLQE